VTGQPERAVLSSRGAGRRSAMAYANAVAVALATRSTRPLCSGCGCRPCRCVSVTPAELTAIRDALAAVTTGAERPVLDVGDRAALADAACWRTMSAYALCSGCHAFPDHAVELCANNRADLEAAAAYQRLARWLATFPGWQGSGTTDSPSAGASWEAER
jgi:hypothetical protein